jgi:DNA-directed RNA polymerase
MIKADNIFGFASFALTLAKIDKDPNYKVYIPVFLDATCSGIQHLAALLKD